MKISRHLSVFLAVVVALEFTIIYAGPTVHADEASQVITGIERQPFVAATRRLVEAMDFAGAPLSSDIRQKIAGAAAMPDDKDAVK